MACICYSAISSHPGRAGPARGHGLHHQPYLPHPVLPGAARLHILVPRGRATQCGCVSRPSRYINVAALCVKQVISYDSSRGGVSVVTEKGAATTSYLLVQDAAPADSGRYSCSPSNAEVASVRVHVLNVAWCYRGAAGGHADGQRGAVQQLARDRGAAGAVRAARAAAARPARLQLIARASPRTCSAVYPDSNYSWTRTRNTSFFKFFIEKT
ncbi:hypothetical protein HF086_013133 [Spodoptera exigua]|uniref:Ig-like domain-containing protein n=1 Tax=Spodoptera exigua TaxID=7107 RepID=A0A922MBA0_SPOEX|nr:hypothetical protein HF086_013133 [Spodoptera exigua]